MLSGVDGCGAGEGLYRVYGDADGAGNGEQRVQFGGLGMSKVVR